MSKSQNIRLRLDADKIQALDTIAYASTRDRSSLLNEALANYLDLQAHHAGLIEEGLRAVNEQRTISLTKLRRKIANHARGHSSKTKKITE